MPSIQNNLVKTDSGFANTQSIDTLICPVCGYELDINGKLFKEKSMCPSCGAAMKPKTDQDVQNDIDYGITKENRQIFRVWLQENIILNEGDPLTDVSQIGAEWKSAGSKISGAARRAKEHMSASSRLARIRKRIDKKKYKLTRKAARHITKSKVHSMKAKRYQLRQPAYEGAYKIDPIDLQKYITKRSKLSYLKHKIKQTKRAHRINRLQRKVDYVALR